MHVFTFIPVSIDIVSADTIFSTVSIAVNKTNCASQSCVEILKYVSIRTL